MEKVNRRFNIVFNFENWEYGIEIKKMREDLDALEKLGATHIEIDSETSYNCSYVSIEGYTNRDETDEEYNERIERVQAEKEEIKKNELEQLKKLKLKYD